jgi:SAM-dependent methyltransferase
MDRLPIGPLCGINYSARPNRRLVEERQVHRVITARLDRSIEEYARAHPQLGEGEVSPLLEAAIRLLPDSSARILDLGCGEGGTLKGTTRRHPSISIIGLDLSVLRARIAASMGAPTLVGDTNQLPFPESSVSLVILRHVIEHVENDVMTLREIRRVLRPNGLLYLETPLRLKGAWYVYKNQSGSRVLDPTHLREYRSTLELQQRLVESELFPVYWNVRPISFPLSHIVYRLMGRFRVPEITRSRLLAAPPRPRLIVPRYKEIQVLCRAISSDGRP